MKPDTNQQLKIGELPQLQIVPIERVIFHEENDPERTGQLAGQLRKEAILKNPPVVSPHPGNGKFILLDGANRLMALESLGIPDALVQVIELSDPGLRLQTWHHAIEHLGKDSLLNTLGAMPGISLGHSSPAAVKPIHHNSVLCRLQFHDATVYEVAARRSLTECLEDLRAITAVYRGFRFMDRVSYTNLDHLKKNYPAFSGLITFRTITKDDILEIASKGLRIPSGITRIVLPKRALRVNIPLDILRFDALTAEKNHWLRKRIDEQIKQKSIRFYNEPTFLFDE